MFWNLLTASRESSSISMVFLSIKWRAWMIVSGVLLDVGGIGGIGEVEVGEMLLGGLDEL